MCDFVLGEVLGHVFKSCICVWFKMQLVKHKLVNCFTKSNM